MRKLVKRTATLLLLFLPQILQSQNYPTEEDIFDVLKSEVDHKRSNSIVVGVIDQGVTHYVAYGKPIEGSDLGANEKTIYEIASITKVFVSTLLSKFILNGKIGLDDPMVNYLPDTLKYMDHRYREVTIKHLATHTSGLPIVTGAQNAESRQQFHKNLSYKDIFEAFEKTEISFTPGTRFEYTNINMSVVAFILCSLEDKDMETLMNEYIYEPFEMKNTTLTLSEEQKKRFATAYIRPGVAVENWEWGAGAGAGGLRSTAEDLILFLRKLFYEESGLSDAAQYAIKVQQDSTMFKGTKIGLGWFITEFGERTWVGHSGTARGFKSFLLYDLKSERGAVVLSNSPVDVSDIGFFLFDKERTIKEYKAPKIKKPDEDLISKTEGAFLVTLNDQSDTAYFYQRGDWFFVFSSRTGEDELLYQKGESFYFPQLNTNIQFEDFRNNKFHSLKGIEMKTLTGKRIR